MGPSHELTGANRGANRRDFLKRVAAAGGAAFSVAGILTKPVSALMHRATVSTSR